MLHVFGYTEETFGDLTFRQITKLQNQLPYVWLFSEKFGSPPRGNGKTKDQKILEMADEVGMYIPDKVRQQMLEEKKPSG